MDISPLQRPIKAADMPFDMMARSTTLPPQEKVKELSRQFEAIMLRQILQEAQKSVIKSSYHQDTAVSGIYQDMVVNRMADDMSKSGGFGLAHSLETQMTRQLLAAQPPAGDGSAAPATPPQ
jgi:Rod binding domain-containing protein